MLIRKIILIAVLAFGLGLTGLQAQTMYVKEKNGSQTSFTINNIRKMTFSDVNMIVTKIVGNSKTYALTDIRYLNFFDLSTGISPPVKPETEMTVLYPNPVNDILTIYDPMSVNGILQVEIVTLEGKIVFRQVVEIQSETKNAHINVSSIPNGLYLCRLFKNKTVTTNKFIKY
jgi:hypothetical protein